MSANALFLIAGEPSGDSLGAALMAALKREDPSLSFSGVGGDLMEAQGMKSLLPMKELAVMGLWEIAAQLPRLWKLLHALAERIEQENPAAVITIDFQEFNYHLARTLKKRRKYKGRIIHYVAPTVWAWRPGRAKKIARVFDLLLCLFPFEPALFQKHKLKAVHVGHPIVEKAVGAGDAAAFRTAHSVRDGQILLGVFFGSREKELAMSAPVFRDTLAVVREQHPDVRLLVPTLPHLEYEVFETMKSWNCGEEPVFVSDPEKKRDAFAACDVAMAVSGTVGLELAYHGIPHVIAYKMNPLSWEILKRLVKVRQAHLANILLGETVAPEYLQGNCDPLKIAGGVLSLLKNPEERARQKAKFAALPALLGAGAEKSPSARAAEAVLSAIRR